MNWAAFSPELYTAGSALILLVTAMVARPARRALFFTALTLAAAGIAVALAAVHQSALLFVDTYRVDLFAQVFKVLLAIGLFMVICLCDRLEGVAERWHAEFYLLLFICTLAMMLLVSAVHLVTIYVALELSSYSLYVLTVLRREQQLGLEAGLKYFLVGVVASVVMLFGMALLYAAAGTAYVADLAQVLPALGARPLVVLALLMSLGGFFFKLALFPFHFWAPDVYQGSAHQLGAYIAGVSKIAAIAVLLRLTIAGGRESQLLVDLLVGLAVVSMTIGNLAALSQRDFKRLMAFSSVAQAGYILIGVLSLSPEGVSASIFYALALLVLKITCFLVIVQVACEGRNVTIEELAGLHRRSPLLAMVLMMALFGLAGIPPTIGFSAKLLVFSAAISQGYLALVIIAMFNVVISLYYYLSVVKAAYLLEPQGPPRPAIELAPVARFLALALLAVMVVGGFWPGYLIECARAASQLLF